MSIGFKELFGGNGYLVSTNVEIVELVETYQLQQIYCSNVSNFVKA